MNTQDNATHRYRVFLSYAHADRGWARRLAKALETWKVPRRLVGRDSPLGPIPRTLGPVFRDRDELAASATLGDTITRALEESATMVVLCSPAAARSRWVNEEVRSFKALGRGERIFALVVDGDPAAGDGPRQCFPSALRFHVDQRGGVTDQPVEPAAADARPEGDGPGRARTKLFAGLLGVSYDTLRRRERKRRMQRLALAASVVLVAIVVALGLALDARRARVDAARNQAQSDALIGYLVEQRHPELARIDTSAASVTLDDGTQLGPLAPGQALDDATLEAQAGALVSQAGRWISRSNLDPALQAARLAHTRQVELVRRRPGDQQRIFDLGQAAFWVGYAYWARRDMDRAERWLSAYRDTARVLAAQNPDRLEWVREKAYGDHNIAAWQAELGHTDAAVRMFEEELATLEDLLARGFEPRTTRQDIAAVMSFLAECSETLGDLPAATGYFAQSVAGYEALVGQDSADPQLRHSLGNQLLFLARLQSVTGEVEAALDSAGRALEIQSALGRADPDNREWARSRFIATRTRAEILAATGRHDEARPLFDALLSDASLASLPTGSESVVIYALTTAARADAVAGDSDRGLARIDRAVAMARVQADAHPERPDDLAALGLALVTRGRLLGPAGDDAGAARALARAYDLLRPLVADAAYWVVTDPFVRAALLTGHEAEARSAMAALESAGYVPLWPWPGPPGGHP